MNDRAHPGMFDFFNDPIVRFGSLTHPVPSNQHDRCVRVLDHPPKTLRKIVALCVTKLVYIHCNANELKAIFNLVLQKQCDRRGVLTAVADKNCEGLQSRLRAKGNDSITFVLRRRLKKGRMLSAVQIRSLPYAEVCARSPDGSERRKEPRYRPAVILPALLRHSLLRARFLLARPRLLVHHRGSRHRPLGRADIRVAPAVRRPTSFRNHAASFPGHRGPFHRRSSFPFRDETVNGRGRDAALESLRLLEAACFRRHRSPIAPSSARSEERRVGKECRSR